MSHSKTGLATLFALPLLVLASGCPESEPEDFGVINIEFDRAAAEDPFPGTREVVLQAVYLEDCLATFYAMNPEFAQDGKDGAATFDSYKDRLCDSGEDFNSDLIPCNVISIEQIETTDDLSLRVTYEILDDDMTQHELAFGPLPTEDLVDCAPRVQLFGNSATGKDSDGLNIWTITSLPAPSTARTNQGAAMRLEIGRL